MSQAATAIIRCRHIDGTSQSFAATVRAVFDGTADADQHEVFVDSGDMSGRAREDAAQIALMPEPAHADSIR